MDDEQLQVDRDTAPGVYLAGLDRDRGSAPKHIVTTLGSEERATRDDNAKLAHVFVVMHSPVSIADAMDGDAKSTVCRAYV